MQRIPFMPCKMLAEITLFTQRETTLEWSSEDHTEKKIIYTPIFAQICRQEKNFKFHSPLRINISGESVYR